MDPVATRDERLADPQGPAAVGGQRLPRRPGRGRQEAPLVHRHQHRGLGTTARHQLGPLAAGQAGVETLAEKGLGILDRP